MGPKLVCMHAKGEPPLSLGIEHGYMLDQSSTAASAVPLLPPPGDI